MTRALWRHLLLTFRLNFRSPQALAYGYLVPVFFVIAFGSVFRAGTPPLANEMGQLLTISVLGGACFGMPTAMVAERERGVWRRYRLLPAATGAIVLSTMAARFAIVLTAAAMQVALARLLFGTPWPLHPAQLVAALAFVSFAFLGMGLVIAMLADAVPAVQAIGQSIFLPMIMVGGVGVPLAVLPEWAGHAARFMPGWYAVNAVQPCVNGPRGLPEALPSLAALAVIGAAAVLAGSKLFRWDAGQRATPENRRWVLLALAGWLAVGTAAELSAGSTRHADARPPTGPPTASAEPYDALSPADAAGIRFDELPSDTGIVVPLAASLGALDPADARRVRDLSDALNTWPPGNDPSVARRVRHLLCVAAVADVAQDPNEGEIALVVFERLRVSVGRGDLEKALAWVASRPGEGPVLEAVAELGIPGRVDGTLVRERSAIYAKKFLLRLR